MSVNVAMWSKALLGIPRIDREQWGRLDLVSRWLIATRAAVLVMTLIAAAIGGLLGYRMTLADPSLRFRSGLWLLCAAGLLLSHATNNLINDLTDHWKGVDRGDYFRAQYGPQPLEHGLLSVRQVLGYITATGALALGIGGYLVAVRGGGALALLGVGAFFVLFYTWPLKYIGLGEVAVLLVWGPLMVGGTAFIATGRWDRDVALAGLVYALGPTAVLFGKHIDKLEADAGKRIRTLPVLLGERAARLSVLAMMGLQYALVIYLCAARFFSPALLLVLLALPALRLAARAYLHPRPAAPPPELPAGVWPLWFVALAFHHTRRFGLLFLIGLVLDVVLRRLH